jgi:hypothetical protein
MRMIAHLLRFPELSALGIPGRRPMRSRPHLAASRAAPDSTPQNLGEPGEYVYWKA